MADPILDEERAAWGRLAEAASSGPWDVEPGTDEDAHCAVLIDDPNDLVANFLTSEPSDKPAGPEMDQAWSDALFCKAARTALPRLLAENAELRAALAGAEAERDDAFAECENKLAFEKSDYQRINTLRQKALWRALVAEAALAGAEAEQDRLHGRLDAMLTLGEVVCDTNDIAGRHNEILRTQWHEAEERAAAAEAKLATLEGESMAYEDTIKDIGPVIAERDELEAKLEAAERALARVPKLLDIIDHVVGKDRWQLTDHACAACTKERGIERTKMPGDLDGQWRCVYHEAKATLAAGPAAPASPKETHNG